MDKRDPRLEAGTTLARLVKAGAMRASGTVTGTKYPRNRHAEIIHFPLQVQGRGEWGER